MMSDECYCSDMLDRADVPCDPVCIPCRAALDGRVLRRFRRSLLVTPKILGNNLGNKFFKKP
jgi:hypothetical protein